MPKYSDIYPTSVVANIKDRVLIGWTGSSLNSNLGLIRGTTLNATVQGSVVKVGSNALQFANQNTALPVRLNETLSNLKQFSICFWSRQTAFNYGGVFASWDSDSVVGGQLLIQNANGGQPSGLPVWIQFGAAYGSTFYNVLASPGLVVADTWYHAICEVDVTNLQLRLFINNNLIGVTNLPLGYVLNTGNETFSLGGYSLADSSITNMNIGYVNEFAIIQGNTTQAERDWLWNSGNGNTLA